MRPQITLVSADDWQGMYLNGVLKISGHRLSPEHVLAHLDVDVHTISLREDSEWLGWEVADLPDDLGDIPEQERAHVGRGIAAGKSV